MKLSSDLISRFVKVTKDNKEVKGDSLSYGTIYKTQAGGYEVQIDGSASKMPISLTQIATGTLPRDGSRVIVLIKNHKATIMGSLEGSDPGKQTTAMEDLSFTLEAIDNIKAENVEIRNTLSAHKATIDDLTTDNLTVNNTLDATIAIIEYLKANSFTAENINAAYAKIEELKATDIEAFNINSTYGAFVVLATEKFEATDAIFKNLKTEYADIGLANVNEASIWDLYVRTGLIEDVTVDDAVIHNLVGVKINGNLIEGDTIVANKLVIKGADGLYYKLNTDGVRTEAEQTEYNSIHGSLIMAESISASKISVSDLSAFRATVGGFHISDTSIYSGSKNTIDSALNGLYMDKNGQISIGGNDHYLKYYRDESGEYRLSISADSIMLSNGDGLNSLVSHIQVTYDDNDPKVSFVSSDKNVKLSVTNSGVEIEEAGEITTYISNKMLNIDRVYASKELQCGPITTTQRANGNVGEVWTGGGNG